MIKFRTRYERQFLDVGCIDLAISNGGAEMHQWDTPTVCIGPLSLVVEGVNFYSSSLAWKKVKIGPERNRAENALQR